MFIRTWKRNIAGDVLQPSYFPSGSSDKASEVNKTAIEFIRECPAEGSRYRVCDSPYISRRLRADYKWANVTGADTRHAPYSRKDFDSFDPTSTRVPSFKIMNPHFLKLLSINMRSARWHLTVVKGFFRTHHVDVRPTFSAWKNLKGFLFSFFARANRRLSGIQVRFLVFYLRTGIKYVCIYRPGFPRRSSSFQLHRDSRCSIERLTSHNPVVWPARKLDTSGFLAHSFKTGSRVREMNGLERSEERKKKKTKNQWKRIAKKKKNIQQIGTAKYSFPPLPTYPRLDFSTKVCLRLVRSYTGYRKRILTLTMYNFVTV